MPSPTPTDAPRAGGKGPRPQRIALYAGTFDPVTYGHLNLMARGLKMFDKLVIAVGNNARKQPLFTRQERMQMIRDALGENVRAHVDEFDGLLVEYARKLGASCLLRGLRAVGDFENEFQQAHMNRYLTGGDLETIFLMTGEEQFFVSSTVVREVATLGGRVKGLVPPNVVEALERKFAGQPAVGEQP